MAPQYSQPTRLRDYIAFLLPWAHGHQLKAIGDFVAAIIEQQTACQAQLARYFGNQEAAVKRLARLLHNERLDPRLLADAVLLQALHQLADPEKSWQTNQKSGPTVPSRADVCLVPEEISSLGGPVGSHRGLLRGVSGDCHDSYLDS
jgi:hypothetical protein